MGTAEIESALFAPPKSGRSRRRRLRTISRGGHLRSVTLRIEEEPSDELKRELGAG